MSCSHQKSDKRNLLQVTKEKKKTVEYEYNLMENYGHLLTCPLCHELFTHPVLLPCHHSMCYGCARAQLVEPLMTSSIDDQLSEAAEDDLISLTSSLDLLSRENSFLDSVESSPVGGPLNGHGNSSGSQSVGRRTSSRARNLSNYSINCNSPPTNAGASFVISTKDFLHFQQTESNTEPPPPPPRSDQQQVSSEKSPHRKVTKKLVSSSSVGKKVWPSPGPSFNSLRSPSRKTGSKFRRCSSASSIARAAASRTHSQNQQSYESIKRSKIRSLFCPSCHQQVELGSLGISGLFRNFALETIVERFRSAAKAAVAIRCGYCKPPAADATKSCLDCQLSYCNECFKVVHIWGTKKAQHDYVGPTNNFSRPKVLLCPEHSHEAVTMYCNKCKKSVCRMCRLGGGSHVNHPVSSAKSAFKEARERLVSDLAALKEKKQKVEAKIAFLGEAFSAFERKELETREEIHSAIDDMHRLLEVKRNDLLGKAEAQMREKEEKLRSKLQKQRLNLMYAGVASFVEEILKESDPSFFLQTVTMVESRMKEAFERLSEDSELDQSDCALCLHLNLEPLKEKLEALDYISKPNAPEFTANADEHNRQTDLVTWTKGEESDVVDYYEIRWTPNDGDVLIYQTDQKTFKVPAANRSVEGSISVRAFNKSGHSQWTQRMLSGRVARNYFKLLTECIAGVTMNASERKAQVMSADGIIFQGDTGLWNGNYTWETIITLKGESHAIVGASDLRSTDRSSLHGCIAEQCGLGSNRGALVLLMSGQMVPYEGDISCHSTGNPPPLTCCNSGINPVSFGSHRYALGISLRICDANEATATFYAVEENAANEKRLLFQKTFSCAVPVWPIFIAKGSVDIELL